MITRPQLGTIIVLAVGTIVLMLWLSGEPVSLSWFGSIGTSVALTYLMIKVFDRWAWRWALLQGWYVNRPHLWGKWDVTIKSEWEDPETGARPDEIKGTLSIRQTYSKVHARLRTNESQGDLATGTIKMEDDGRYWFYGVYRNEPDLTARRNSPVHNGSFRLEVEGKPNSPTKLRGHYWTDRKTQGMLVAIPTPKT